jgi:hypothetical protein
MGGLFLPDGSPQLVAGGTVAASGVQFAESSVRERAPSTGPELDLANNHGLFRAAAEFHSHGDREPFRFGVGCGFQWRLSGDRRDQHFRAGGHDYIGDDPGFGKL